MWFRHSMRIAHQLIPIHNTTVNKNRGLFMLPLTRLKCSCHIKDTNMPQWRTFLIDEKTKSQVQHEYNSRSDQTYTLASISACPLTRIYIYSDEDSRTEWLWLLSILPHKILQIKVICSQCNTYFSLCKFSQLKHYEFRFRIIHCEDTSYLRIRYSEKKTNFGE